MIDKRRCILSIFISVLCGLTCFGQECGTVVTKEQVDFESLHPVILSSASVPDHCLNRKLSITVWMILNKSGSSGITQAAVLNAIKELNVDFAPICLSFEACEFKTIENWNYYELLHPREASDVYTQFQVPKTINLYLCDSLEEFPGTFVCGLANFPGGPDAIFMNHSCLKSGEKSLAHEMGHFFGLYHTFETKFGNELVNGSNCSTKGDLLCDTPADPKADSTIKCQIEPYTKDANGDWYVPLTSNIMSYYGDCRCSFTIGQYNRMIQQYLNIRNYLW